MRVTVSRKAHFNAAHRLYRKDWSMEKNDVVFGKCNNPNYHGHNYDLIVSVTGEIDQETGFVVDVKVELCGRLRLERGAVDGDRLPDLNLAMVTLDVWTSGRQG